jgi:hypothetical protein
VPRKHAFGMATLVKLRARELPFMSFFYGKATIRRLPKDQQHSRFY